MLRNGMFIADRYEIIEHIGSGGMSDVYKAKDHKLNRFVAVKVLKHEFSEDQSFVSKFRVEAQSAAGLTHPNIVNVFDVGDEDGIHYIVMELVEGIVLKKYIEKKGKLNVREATSILIQVAQGIECAHNHHIIHRDIKPQNIIISKEGKVKVADFGIARAASTNTINSSAMGSVHYISPEQARGGYSDEKSDIYSLGITFYEMVTGTLPFDGDNTVSVALQHIQEKMISPREYVEDLPISTEKIILKCTLKKPDRRYAKVSDLIADLKRSLVSPDVDFVKIIDNSDIDTPQTVILTQEQMREISEKSAGNVYDDDDDYNNSYDDEDEEYDEDEDEEGIQEEGDVNPKFDKAMTGLLIGVAVIIVFITIFLIVKMIGIFNTSKPDKEETSANTTTESQDMVEVPKLIGYTEEEATKKLKSMGLNVKVKKEQSDEYDEGIVFKQSEEQGKMVEKNTSIVITISSGVATFELKDYSGMSEDDATSALKKLNLEVVNDYQYDSSVEQGTVIKTQPAAGSDVSEGDTITIIVSKGSENVKMINVLGKTEGEARQELEAIGLKVADNITKDYSKEYGAGQVMNQSYAAGTELAPGTEVSIAISLGEEAKYTYRAKEFTISNSDSNNSYDSEVAGKQNVSKEHIKVVLEQDGAQSVVLKDTDFSNNFNFTFSNIEGAEGLTSGTVKVYLSYTYEVESEISETTGESEEATAKPTVETKTVTDVLIQTKAITFDKVQQ
ncbi:Stk1 family PASTA domain-containing Ser/Thr kinase [Falcatimonas sp. MSJ-15]|uniref:Stk1 family PASTA domain-containing Ser/Thr kinase n=1 Tax=Falcatimonas sp. MSJ-15 TaxID=2841515 RepID=UPI001C0F99F8|nr:Stk1 family PASTA domain-containing Ser/Thr kinase [Falcatimonas sp. MSJ-15]MBU5469580.1 Stk1 family PASTA domain-containing Ser/Thr kinase [Falcatimonas sp. MSJ-15]